MNRQYILVDQKPGLGRRLFRQPFVLAAAVAGGLWLPLQAAKYDVKVTVENLAPGNSISFAPLRIGFHSGIFDAFNDGQVATAPIISVAEGGSGSAWFPAFEAADPGAVLGSVGGALFPGMTATSASFRIDSSVNPYFTFASMVIPSNDFFIGNDDPMEYSLFDSAGNFVLTEVLQSASEIWNAGSEAFDPLNAAFLVGGNNSLRTPENSVVAFNFTELAGFDGLTTAAGYVFASQLTDDSPVYRISFDATAVPEATGPAALLGGVLALAGFRVHRRRCQLTAARS